MITTEKKYSTSRRKMSITVQGRKIILLFSEKPNPEIATRVKQALIGTYMFADVDKTDFQACFLA